MITLSNDAAGEILFRTVSGSLVEDSGFGQGSVAGWEIRDGAIVGVPEPTTLALAGLGVVGFLGSRRRRNR